MRVDPSAAALLRHLLTGRKWPPDAPVLAISTLLEEGGRYALAPWLASRLSMDDVPASLRIGAASALELETIRSTLLLHDLQDVTRWLLDAGIRSIPIKGAALLAERPGAAGWRHTEDIDLLIEPGRVAEADEVLSALRLPFVHAKGAVLVDGSAAEAGYVSDMHHLYPRRLPRGTPVELHSRLPASELSWEDLWGDASFLDQGLRLPSAEHQLEILSKHVFRHHFAQVPMLARHCVDVRYLLSMQPGLVGKSVDARFSLWLERELRSEPGPSATFVQQLVVPGPRGARVRHQFAFVLEQRERIQRDLVHRPRFLLSKVWPHDRFMDVEWGPAETTLQNVGRHVRRWKALLLDAKSRGPGGQK
jgi:hypothetical protein